MNSLNQNPNRPSDDLDGLLDSALAKYAAVEPRAGLEQRILASIRIEQARSPRRPWWQWGLVATTLALVVLALSWRYGKPSRPITTSQSQPSTLAPPKPIEQTATATTAQQAAQQRRLPRRVVHRVQSETIVAANPKLDQFPSRQPLSAEEIALAEYVKNFPKEARLIAQAQEEFALESQKVMNEAGSETQPSSSTQPER